MGPADVYLNPIGWCGDILLNPIGCNTADVLVILLGGADSAGFLMTMIGILLGSIG